MIIDLINKFPRIKTFPRKIQKLFWELWEPTITEDRNNRQRQQLYQELGNFSDQVAANLTSGDWNVIANTGTHFVIQEIGFDMYSYPFDDPRNVLRRPDLRDILAFANDFFEIRFIIMVRSELDSIVSLIKRGWWSPAFCDAGMKPPDNTNLFLVTPRGMCGYINVQVRVVEDALIYLNTQLLNLDENYFRVINYHQLLEKPSMFVRPLLKFLGFSEYGNFSVEVGGKALPHVNYDTARRIFYKGLIRKKVNYAPILFPEQVKVIRRVFDPEHSDQWPILNNPRLSISEYEKEDPIPPEQREQRCYKRNVFEALKEETQN